MENERSRRSCGVVFNTRARLETGRMNIFNETDLDSITDGTGLNVKPVGDLTSTSEEDEKTFNIGAKRDLTFNERLDEILSKLARDTTLADRAADIATTPSAVNDASKRYQWSLGDAKQAITSLIKELVEEAKPGNLPIFGSQNEAGDVSPSDYEAAGYNQAIDQFEQNLLKALEER